MEWINVFLQVFGMIAAVVVPIIAYRYPNLPAWQKKTLKIIGDARIIGWIDEASKVPDLTGPQRLAWVAEKVKGWFDSHPEYGTISTTTAINIVQWTYNLYKGIVH